MIAGTATQCRGDTTSQECRDCTAATLLLQSERKVCDVRPIKTPPWRSSAGSATTHYQDEPRVQGLHRGDITIWVSGSPYRNQQTTGIPGVGANSPRKSTPTRGGTDCTQYNTVGRSGGKPHDKLVGNGADSDDDFIPATATAREATISHISTPSKIL
jgi:hypothetical protein